MLQRGEQEDLKVVTEGSENRAPAASTQGRVTFPQGRDRLITHQAERSQNLQEMQNWSQECL